MKEIEIKHNMTNKVCQVLQDRNYHYEVSSVHKIIERWYESKHKLITMFRKHPNWNEDKMMIIFDENYSRAIDTYESTRFSDYLETHHQIPKEEKKRYDNVFRFFHSLNSQFFNETWEEALTSINDINDNFKLRKNMKTTKAVGKICRELGWDKIEGYNASYARFCDAFNPIKTIRHTCISLNPIDFLLMSNGNSWKSCHYIGDEPDDAGCYSSGTISYMLDGCSFIFYTVSSEYNGDDIEIQPKIQRQVFGYNDGQILQSRLYPQSMDEGAEHIYTDIRNIVQKVISDCIAKPNLWILSKNKIGDVVEKDDYATCYADWKPSAPGSQHCSLSILKDRIGGYMPIIMGAEPICVDCGCCHGHEENILCSSCFGEKEVCENCGCIIENESSQTWIDGYCYCQDCVQTCEECGEVHPIEHLTYVPSVEAYVCLHCLHKYYYLCDECGQYEYKDNVLFIGNDVLCSRCSDLYTFWCDECQEYHYIKDGMYEEGYRTYCPDCWNERNEMLGEDNDEEIV